MCSLTTTADGPLASAGHQKEDCQHHQPVRFYFASHPNSQHIQHILEHKQVAVSIFDSNVAFASPEARGIQFSALGRVLVVPPSEENKGTGEECEKKDDEQQMIIMKCLEGLQFRFPKDDPKECLLKHQKMFHSLGYVIVELQLLPAAGPKKEECEGGEVYLSGWGASGDERVVISIDEDLKLCPFV